MNRNMLPAALVASMTLFSACAFAQAPTSPEATPERPLLIVDQEAAPQVVEITPAQPAADVQLPPQRPVRAAPAVRRTAESRPRRTAARPAPTPAPVRVASVQPQRIAAQPPKSPLFWMTVGVGF